MCTNADAKRQKEHKESSESDLTGLDAPRRIFKKRESDVNAASPLYKPNNTQ